MNFTGNKAVIGSAIYTSELALCSWHSYFPPYFYFNASNVLRQPFISYGYVEPEFIFINPTEYYDLIVLCIFV